MKTSWPKFALLVLCCVAVAFEVWHFRNSSNPAPQLPTPVTPKNQPDFTLLPSSEIPRSVEYFVYPKPHAESWEPTLGEIEEVETNLSQISVLNRLDPNPGSKIDDPHRYFRQYLAVVVGGRKKMFLNAFCSDQGNEKDWRKHLVCVLDGGSCYWHATYDLASGKFSDLKVNGLG